MRDPLSLIGQVVAERESTYRREDTLLHALAAGLGGDPLDRGQLDYVYEARLKALPSLCLVLGYPGFWLSEPRHGVDWARVLHAEESFTLHAPLPVAGRVQGTTTVTDIIDRGAEKGAWLHATKTLHDLADGALLATVDSCTLLRGDGGFGGPSRPPRRAPEPPAREPDAICDLPTLPQQALLYRLCGDFNPLHADPDLARDAGFPRPILHGRCTMAVAQHAILRTCCAYDASRLAALSARFSAPFLPGETLRTRIWQEGDAVYFTASAVEREVVVLKHGFARLRSAPTPPLSAGGGGR